MTRESPTTEAARKLVVEPTTAGLYHLTYACLLVPRFSAHYITGDLADQIGEWLPNICIAFGWRLEYLSVRPEYLQWVVNVQPNSSPGYLMRIMRQQTSEKIFSEFPRMKKENPSGDFWAPGYLIMGGTQPHPQQLVRDYIRQTRQRQGQSVAPPVESHATRLHN
jgi:REP element-mobilizing transposase RayT